MSTFQEILKKEESQEALLTQLKETWKSTADDKKSEMLHADDDYAFRWACENGHLTIAEWLWSECKTPDEQSAMLHTDNDYAFSLACQKGHIEIAKWLMGLCRTAEERSAICLL